MFWLKNIRDFLLIYVEMFWIVSNAHEVYWLCQWSPTFFLPHEPVERPGGLIKIDFFSITLKIKTPLTFSCFLLGCYLFRWFFVWPCLCRNTLHNGLLHHAVTCTTRLARNVYQSWPLTVFTSVTYSVLCKGLRCKLADVQVCGFPVL